MLYLIFTVYPLNPEIVLVRELENDILTFILQLDYSKLGQKSLKDIKVWIRNWISSDTRHFLIKWYHQFRGLDNFRGKHQTSNRIIFFYT